MAQLVGPLFINGAFFGLAAGRRRALRGLGKGSLIEPELGIGAPDCGQVSRARSRRRDAWVHGVDPRPESPPAPAVDRHHGSGVGAPLESIEPKKVARAHLVDQAFRESSWFSVHGGNGATPGVAASAKDELVTRESRLCDHLRRRAAPGHLVDVEV